MRPFRSVLYMPGSNPRALEKAQNLSADALILDLEDAVAPDQKANARGLVHQAVSSGAYGNRYLVVRINGLKTEWGKDDVAALKGCAPHAVLMPKVESGAEVRELAALMDAADLNDARIWAMMETPKGILNAADIAQSSPRLEGFVMGTNDLIKDMHARYMPQRQSVLTALGHTLLVGRAHDIICIDGVYNDIKNMDGLLAECEQGRDLGFDGKTLIHPAQLETANTVFGPSRADLDEAHEFVAAFKAAIAQGKAVAVVNGRIVENLHVENAQRLIDQAKAIKQLEG